MMKMLGDEEQENNCYHGEGNALQALLGEERTHTRATAFKNNTTNSFHILQKHILYIFIHDKTLPQDINRLIVQ